MSWQLCPVCKGSGVYCFGHLCDVCMGKKIISEITGLPPDSEQHNIQIETFPKPPFIVTSKKD